MLSRPGRRRQAERGQALLIALAFIVFFGLIATATLNYAGVTGLQQSQTERVASADAPAEGGALLAMNDAQRANGCPASSAGSMTMRTTGDTVDYQVQTCSPGTPSNQTRASYCLLCLLGPASTGTTLSTDQGDLSVSGPIAVNGPTVIGATGTVQSTGPDAFIGCANSCRRTGSFTPAPSPISPVSDPLASSVQLPDLTRVPDCVPPDPDGTTLSPGVYCSLDFSKAGVTYTLTAGSTPYKPYVILGSVRVAASATVVAQPGVVLYLTCGSGADAQACASAGQGGGTIDVAGSLVFQPDPAALGRAVMIFDPHNTGGVTSCGGPVALCVSHQGNISITGTVYGASAPVYLDNNASLTITDHLVVASFISHVGAGVGLSLTGTATAPPCWVEHDLVRVGTGHVDVETGCGGGAVISSFSYAP